MFRRRWAIPLILLVGAACGRPALDLPSDPSATELAGYGPYNSPSPTPPPQALCDVEDPDLLLCFTFDDSTANESGKSLSVQTTNVGNAVGIDGHAAVFTTDSSLSVSDDAVLNPAQLTLEAWVLPEVLPSGGRMGIIDKDGQWGVFVYDGGEVQCVANGVGTASVAGALQAGAWTHVACRYDSDSIDLFLDGVLEASDTGVTNPVPSGSATVNVGEDSPDGDDQFEGLFDSFRWWSVPRTDAQICAAADC